MGAGARLDRIADGIPHAARHGGELEVIAARGSAWLVAVLGAAGAAAAPGEAYEWRLPRGFPVPAVPADNPMSDAKVALGQRLFFEPRLSVSGSHSCASCHDPAKAFTDGRARSAGATGATLPHSSMALVNVAYNVSFGWSRPDVRSLEEQMLQPLLNEHPVEMGLAGREAAVTRLLLADAAYRTAFATAFPREAAPVSFANLVKAIAAYERTLLSGNAPFDRHVFGGDHAALSADARAGLTLFYSGRTGCSACHSGFNFSGNWVDAQGATGEPSFADNGTGEKLRVPTLRNIAMTAPYMHDGRYATLDAVLDHYSTAGPRPFDLDAGERRELLAFMASLTDAEFLARR
jgi:cytochrome c peroxidase